MMKALGNWRGFALVLGLALIASPAFAQTTSLIEGTVLDENGAALPGVTIEISSESMQGTRVDVSNANGNFRFPAVPPGTYTLVAALDGYGTVRQEDVDVDLDRTITLEVNMQPAAFEQVVEVTGEAPVVDVTSTELGTNFDEEQLTSMPLGRNFTAIANVLGGAQYENEDTDSYAIYGSTGAENSYIIDGVDTTEVERGRQGKTVNMEFVEEIQIKTGGYNAEYGRATGGLINVITKSGGNTFHGDVFGYYHTDDTQADFDGKDYDQLVNAPTISTGLTREDYGFDLGGYIVKDRLWFFVAYDLVKRDDSELTSEILQDLYGAPEFATTEREEDQRSAKLTWNINPSHSLVGSFFGDPEDWVGANNAVIRGPEDTWKSTRETGGDNYTFKYLGLPAEDLLINAQWAHHEETDSLVPQNGTDIQIQDRRSVDEFRTGGHGYFFDEEYSRDQWRLDATYFVEAAGTHEFKLGYEEQALEADKLVAYTGGQQVWILSCDPGGSADCSRALEAPDGSLYYYAHEFYVRADSTLDDWEIQPDGYAEVPKTDNAGAFLQDKWRVLSNLTLNLGIRWEEQVLMDGAGREWIVLDDNWAPRIGFVWDPKDDGTSKVYAHYGTFFENIPMDINIRFMGKEVDAFFYNTSETDINPDHDLRQGRIRGSTSILELFEALFGSAVDPDLEGQSVTEYILGYEANLLPNWTFGINGVYRELDTVVEDGGAVLDGEFAYIVGNGGEGFLSEAPDLNYTGAFPVPKPKREYTAVQLTAQRRYRDNWTMYASYVWSELEGNYDGTYQRSTGQLDPNINSSYDYVDFMYVVDPDNPFTTELDGPLSNDREHQLKVSGFYNFDFGLEIGASAYWQSGRPLSAQGWSDAYRNNELWLTQRGALGNMDDEYEIDLHFGYPVQLGDRITLNLYVDIFNVLDRQGIIDVDQLWNLSESYVVDGSLPGCSQYAGQGYSSSLPASCAENPDFLKGIEWQTPQYFRLGAKISF